MAEVISSVVVDMTGFHADFAAMKQSLDAARMHVELPSRSFASVTALRGFLQSIAEAGFNFSDLAVVELADLATGRAGTFSINVGERYSALVSAFARDADFDVRLFHGWPILSVGDRTPTVAEEAVTGNRAASEVPADAQPLARAS